MPRPAGQRRSARRLIACRVEAATAELGGDLRLDFAEFGDVRVEILSLVLELGDVQAAAPQELAQLLHAGAVDLIEIEQLVDLGELEAQPLAAADPA